MAEAIEADRGVVTVEGPDAAAFLDRIVTCAIDKVGPGRARFGALLSPQGKILADFIVLASPDGAFWLDTPASCAPDLARRLGLYRLRAKLAVADRSAELAVRVSEAPPDRALAAAPDPRLPGLGTRAVLRRAEVPEGAGLAPGYGALGVPRLGVDFAPGSTFPHEALMDQFGGVDFDKGCYIGQEIVSRMQHRGTARTRFVSVAFDGPAPDAPATVTAGERTLGELTGVSGARGLALLRVDRAGEALAAGETIVAGGAPMRFVKPDWVRFAYPADLAPAQVA